MRIRAVISATALAATIILSGAGTAMAHDDDHESGASAKYAKCLQGAAVWDGNPVWFQGCEGGSLEGKW
ncbi:hypothetical protein [Streptomyces pinistramenti]|uniref:hypothetical protein n=1 Tax=Streptomyces pinistramenti TaxID=2884812 RepID=UPI001D09087D|nr:hypothetical protein [Streptomyces pinistramenti]MCB5909487.1 hypothetical protein [Streptomyces pinistramenti]